MASPGPSHDPPPKSLIVEGWRFLPHSYAIANQWQLLALLRRHVALKVVDVPFYRRSWQAQEGLFAPQDEQALRAIPVAEPGETADTTLRMFAPFTFAPSRSRLTAVFATLEVDTILKQQMASVGEFEQLRRAPPPQDVMVVTPSRWSAEGFYRFGFRAEQVIIVPLGVDIGTLHPMPDARGHVRSMHRIADSEFVFLSVGAMTGNKGIDLLLRGFAEVSRQHTHERLVLKGMDRLYPSRDLLHKSMQMLTADDRQRIADRITYIGEAMSHQEMAQLYQVADAYVSPYRAEGFNMPVLEAAACGIPLLCTRGGATDDFVTDEFACRIASRIATFAFDGQNVSRLDPNLEHLIELMHFVIENEQWRRQASEAGPRHVAANYTWDHAAGSLIRHLLT